MSVLCGSYGASEKITPNDVILIIRSSAWAGKLQVDNRKPGWGVEFERCGRLLATEGRTQDATEAIMGLWEFFKFISGVKNKDISLLAWIADAPSSI